MGGGRRVGQVGTGSELLEAAGLFFSGRLTPVVDTTYPLASAADAQQRLFQVLAGLALTKTRYGRYVYAVGSNREAARLKMK